MVQPFFYVLLTHQAVPMPYKLLYFTYAFALFATPLAAQMADARVLVQVFADDAALEHATVYFPDLGLGAVTDGSGQARFTNLPVGEHLLEVSYVGYFNYQKRWRTTPGDTLLIRVDLQPQLLETVVVTGSMREQRRSDSPIPVDVISAKLFARNPTPNIFEAVGMVSGVQPVMNCNVCNTGDIQINGIEGVYTQVLLDGMPIVSGLGAVYGLMGIPISLIDRIEVVKGPAGTLYGSEAMAGQINIITRSPDDAPPLAADVMTNTWGEHNVDIGAKLRLGKAMTGLLGINGFWFDRPLDKNGDGFTDVAQQQRVSVFNKWQWKRPDGKVAQLGTRYVAEDRWGGQTHWTRADRGGNQVYGESIYTHRWEVFGNYQLPTAQPMFVQASYNTHRQDSYYGDVSYNARQDIGFVQAYLDRDIGKHRLLAGGAARYTHYDDNTPATATASQTLLPGVFVQDELRIGRHADLLGGLRMDWHPDHGPVWSPRIAWHAHLGERQDVRLSAGSGFRVVSLFTEDHAALSGAREVVVAETLRPERAWSGNLNYNLRIPAERWFVSVDATAFYTYFTNRILPDYDTHPQQIIYANLTGHSATRGATVQVDYSNAWPLRINAGTTWMDVYVADAEGVKTQQIRAPRWSGTLTANYTHPASRIAVDVTGNWFGPQRLATVPLDFRPAYSPWFALLNVQVSRTFKGGFTLYGGVKNLLDFVPAHPILRPEDPFNRTADDPITNPNGYTFDPTYNFAPLQGIRGFVGVRWRGN